MTTSKHYKCHSVQCCLPSPSRMWVRGDPAALKAVFSNNHFSSGISKKNWTLCSSARKCSGPIIRLVHPFLPVPRVLLKIQHEQALIHQWPRNFWCHILFCLAFSLAKKIEYMRNYSGGLWELWGDCRLFVWELCGEEGVGTEKGSWRDRRQKELRVAV